MRPGLRGLWLSLPDGAVGHDVAAGALPLDLAVIKLLLVQRRVHAALAQQGPVGTGFHHAPGVDDVGVDDGRQAVGIAVPPRGWLVSSRACCR